MREYGLLEMRGERSRAGGAAYGAGCNVRAIAVE
jgi:hypothetical protein